ncbi:MAG: hypothetical protein ACRCT6_08875 [Notoacmeibacter sp.]
MSGILKLDPSPWRGRAWAVLKWCTVVFGGTGFLLGVLSLLTGNTMSINGTAFGGWSGVWTLTFALGAAGFMFGLIWFLVLSAIGIAASGGK